MSMNKSERHGILWELLYHLHQQTLPKRIYEAKERITKDSIHLDNMLKRQNPPKIYGVNTLVGHLDNVQLSTEEISEFQQVLLENHCIGIGESYSDYEVRSVSYAKIHSLSLGGSGITPRLYDYLLQIVSNPNFKVCIPKHSSYSSGDVIPGAHWAKEIAEFLKNKFSYHLQRKEGLSLINGSYIHVGIALAKLFKIHSIWSLYNYNSVQYAKIVNNESTNYSYYLTLNSQDSLNYPINWIKESVANNGEYNVQDPVSIRAYPQVASAFFNSVTGYINSIEEQLLRRSDNPIVLFEEPAVLSQGSFLAPMISLATSQLIEACLLVMWSIERRTHFLLSGKIKDIPLNARSKHDSLGFIQVPKLLSALLEESRLEAGRRTFASGSTTSYGIEDLWTNGLITLETLEKLLENMNKMLAIELFLMTNVKSQFLADITDNDCKSYITNGNFPEQIEHIMNDNFDCKLPIKYNLPPFKDFHIMGKRKM